jgi:hypothetical protein
MSSSCAARNDDVIVVAAQRTEVSMARKRVATQKQSERPAAAATRMSHEPIRGIALTVNGRELAVRIGERIRWHRERGDTLIEQMKKLTDVERTAAEDLANILGRYDSPRMILEKRLREHRDRATFLTFVRDHIAPDQVYRLDSSDLRMIDVLPER